MDQQKEERIIKTQHHWKMRLIVAIIMLGLSFLGLVISDIRKSGPWNYWRCMVPVFAVLCLFLSWYLRHHKKSMSFKTMWHELVQWCGLALTIYLVSTFVNIGLMGRFEAGLVVLTLLALNIFITGIYVECQPKVEMSPNSPK